LAHKRCRRDTLTGDSPQVRFEEPPMAQHKLRVVLIGAGGNMRLRHIPGLRAIPDVEIVAFCNRRPASTSAAARESGIPRTFEHWEQLVHEPAPRAIVMRTWR